MYDIKQHNDKSVQCRSNTEEARSWNEPQRRVTWWNVDLILAHIHVSVSHFFPPLPGVDGDYFRLLLPGTYTVTASASGYVSSTNTVTVGPAEAIQVCFHSVFWSNTHELKDRESNSWFTVVKRVQTDSQVCVLLDLHSLHALPLFPRQLHFHLKTAPKQNPKGKHHSGRKNLSSSKAHLKLGPRWDTDNNLYKTQIYIRWKSHVKFMRTHKHTNDYWP